MSDFRKSRFLKIEDNIHKTDSIVKQLKQKRISKIALQNERLNSIDSLDETRNQLNFYVAKTRSEISKLQVEIESENKKKDIVKQNLNKQIEIQQEKKTNTEVRKTSKQDDNITSKFEASRKFLIWPLAKFVILHHYGDYSHPTLDIIIKNDGIELGAKNESNVHCIFDGQVVDVVQIPGGGTSVIIRHGDFFSVYSKVNKVYVSKSDNVQKGQVIAKLSGNETVMKLNFQLWRGKEKLNPELWLKRQ